MNRIRETGSSRIPDDPKIFRFDCGCGRFFHLAISTTTPGLFALGETFDDAIIELEKAAKRRIAELFGEVDIPDCLPEDF